MVSVETRSKDPEDRGSGAATETARRGLHQGWERECAHQLQASSTRTEALLTRGLQPSKEEDSPMMAGDLV